MKCSRELMLSGDWSHYLCLLQQQCLVWDSPFTMCLNFYSENSHQQNSSQECVGAHHWRLLRWDWTGCYVMSPQLFSTKACTAWSFEVPSLLILWRFSLVLLAWKSNVKIQQKSFQKTDEQGSSSQGFMSNQCIIPSSLFNLLTSL